MNIGRAMNKEYINSLKDFSKNLTVLYVEDNKEARNSTIELLKIFFNNIIIAYDGMDGIEKFNSSIDIIITDINMPKMNGIDMIKKIKEINNNIPVLIISAHNETEYLMDSIKSKVYDYILKPIQTNDFINIISKILDTIKDKTDTLKYQDNLENKIIEQDKIIHQQAKLAAMGEMIDSIAHQWQQPINAISLNIQSLQMKDMVNEDLTFEDVNMCANKVNIQIQHLLSTMNEFRNFFRPNISTQKVLLEDSLKSILILLKDTITSEKMNINIMGDLDTKVNIIQNEFKHIVINIINNAKDEFKKDQKNKKIDINIRKELDFTYVDISDNAGGIPENIIDHIFKSNFTTKDDGKGTGIGLYMSKTIIEKINGTILVKNVKDGAMFTIKIPN